MTIASIEKIFIEDLTGLYGPEEAGSIAWLVIGFVCKINRTQYLNNKNDDLSGREVTTFHRILSDLKKGVPVQYLLGETEFYGSIFKVNSSVLIPRPETEELVDWVLKDLKIRIAELQEPTLLDIGTGSGCIPISIKKYLPNLGVAALEVSNDALEVAKENAKLNHTDIHFTLDDILNPTADWQTFSVITSNPPYVTLAEKNHMHVNVLEHEPHLALFVPEDDPLVFYEAIARFASQHLEKGGFIYLEINENLGQETVSLLSRKGFRNIQLRQDLRDRDRMIRAQM
ncbi:peptide chain release factor N(5)-glutamine methyltransferase [Daejeonella lutea]|uniref:peptide chain release factor N(5)-glutamine methyltransferase n=1 Tax=Daejeonella lutea TaxID=572036 RepID=A0A1T5AH82_9SPHI|nr:peptide chain release factor N(5)-glutamine methyltransferase [Daejeonella lutea]SKB34362.1 release factor glutamine methyltransferase [Daejeonella lutea]